MARLLAPIGNPCEPVSEHFDFVLVKKITELACGFDNSSRVSLGNSLVACKDFQ